MELPRELQSHIIEFADNGPATLRDNWQEGSSIIKILKQDRLWFDYRRWATLRLLLSLAGGWDEDCTWVDWCKDNMIIGPPRNRTTLPEWVITDYIAAPNPTVC